MMTKLTEVTRAFRAMNTDGNVAVSVPAADVAISTLELAKV